MTRLKRFLGGVGLVLLLAAPVAGQGALAPIGIQQGDNNGNPCSGCVLVSFAAGTSTPLATFADSALGTSNGTSVTLDGSGRATVFLDSRLSYKLTLRTATGTDIWTRDGVVGQLSGVVTVAASDTRGLRVSRASADAGISIASTGGSGKTYGLVSDTAGGFTIRDDSDGTPNMQWLGNNITATLTGTFTVSGGTVNSTGFGANTFVAGGTGVNSILIRNTAAGTGNGSRLFLGNDATLQAGTLTALSTTFTTSAYNVQDSTALEGARPGGVSIAASHPSGALRFYAGGSTTPVLSLSAAGVVSVGAFAGTVVSPNLGTTHNYDIASASVITYFNGVGAADITGIVAPTGAGRMIWVFTSPASAGSLTLQHEDPGSTAANRITSATGADIVVSGVKAVQLIYDTGSSRWLAFDVK